jgi:hypothetical protein
MFDTISKPSMTSLAELPPISSFLFRISQADDKTLKNCGEENNNTKSRLYVHQLIEKTLEILSGGQNQTNGEVQ